jgi:lipoprotein NlpD
MKIIFLLFISLSLSSCFGDDENQPIRIKVIDKSIYAFDKKISSPEAKAADNAQDSYQMQTELGSSNANTKIWVAPVKANIYKKYSSNNQMLVYNTKPNMAVYAIKDGTVVYSSDNLKAFGKMIIIKHKYGFYSHYMFNGKLLVGIGDKVETGRQIATTSTKKFSLQMKKFTTLINPADYIK